MMFIITVPQKYWSKHFCSIWSFKMLIDYHNCTVNSIDLMGWGWWDDQQKIFASHLWGRCCVPRKTQLGQNAEALHVPQSRRQQGRASLRPDHWQPMTSRVGATKGPPRGRHQHTEMSPWGSSIAFYLGPTRGQLWTAISSTRGPDKTLDVTFQNLLKFSHANRGLEAHLVHIVGSEDLLKTSEGIVQSFDIKWWRHLEKYH